MLRLPFTSDEAKTESRNFETMYFAAVTASMEMAKEEAVFKFCRIPISQGNFSTIYGD
jgi:ribonucleoside-diphosphate reductase alpha chain